jgi:hypothetical protein
MEVSRVGEPQEPPQVQVDQGRRQQVRATDDRIDALPMIVEHAREVVRGQVIASVNDVVTRRLVKVDLNKTLQVVDKAEFSRVDARADRSRARMRDTGAAGPGVPAPPAGARFDVFAAAAAPKGNAALEQSLRGGSILGEARVLVNDLSIPVKTVGIECSQDVACGVGELAQRIDILDAHEPIAAGLARM